MTVLHRFLLAVAIGIAAHLGFFIRGEWHMQAPTLAVVHLLTFILTYVFHVQKESPMPLINGAVIIAGYMIGLFSSITAYRLSPFHRLQKFPGPKMAAITKFWHVWQCRESKNHEVMVRLHKAYEGDFLRIGPSELVSFHPDSFTALEGFATLCTKSDFYDILLPDFSLVFTRNKKIHDARRNVWSRALSTKGESGVLMFVKFFAERLAIAEYRGRIDRQIGVLMDKLEESATAGEPVVINDVMYWFSFDSMGEFAFNQDFGMMKRGEWHDAIDLFRRALSLIGPFSPMIWLIKIGFAFFPWFWKIGDWFSMMRFCHEQMEKRMVMEPKERDISSYFIEEAERNPDDPFRENWIKGDGATVIVAGSDTTAPTLTFICYCLAQHPDYQEKIFEELQSTDPGDANALAALPILNGCINEAMRLYSVAPTVVSRQTPPEGIMIGDTYIPGNTKMLAPRWIIFRLESCFTDANSFIPERWSTRPELVKNKNAFSPFGTGRASCVGKGLAMTQLRIVMARMVKRYQLRFLPGDDAKEVLRDMRDMITAQPGKLRLDFVKRMET